MSAPRAPTARSATRAPTAELTGYDVEVAEAVGEKLGSEVEFDETQWDAIFAGLEAGRFDIIANQVSINDERKAKYDFSEPYTVSEGVIVTVPTTTRSRRFDDLDGKTTAQSLTSNWSQLAKRRRRERRGRRGLGPGRRSCSSRAASTRPSTTS